MTGAPGSRILDWDSEFFGFPVARIEPPRLEWDQLSPLLASLRRDGVRLAYWATTHADASLRDRATDVGGLLVDHRLTYRARLADGASGEAGRGRAAAESVSIGPFVASDSMSALEELAVQSGAHSRFAVDPNIPTASFEALYREWARRSLAGPMADEVLVARSAAGMAGMVTVQDTGEAGAIRLIAVREGMRGRGVGGALVVAAKAWSAARGRSSVEVVTQGANRGARELYAKHGFELERSEDFFHFWL